jgi:hypothetical protein
VVAAAAGFVLPTVIVGSVYLAPIATKDFAAPVGFDAPKYVWRSNLVRAEGLDALAASAPEPFRVNADRPGFPSVMGAVASLLDTSPARVILVLPAVLAVAVGLAAGSLAVRCLRQPRWAFAVFAVATGASVQVSRMAGPAYLDNLLLAPIAVAAAGLALFAAGGDRGAAGAVALLVAGWLVHWVFVLLLVGLVAASGLVLIRTSIREWRAGRHPLSTESGRLLAIAGAGGLLGGAALLGLSSTEPAPPRLPRSSFLSKLRADIPRYAFPALAPAAAIGAATVRGLGLRLSPGHRSPDDSPIPRSDADALLPRRALLLMLLWTLSGGVAVLALHLGFGIPAHRFLAFGMGMPFLFAAGVLAVGRLASRLGTRSGSVAGAAVVVACLAAGVTISYRGWFQAHPWMPRAQLQQAAEAGAYLQRAGGDGPIIFVVDLGGHSPLSGTSLAFHVIRAALPPEVVPRTLVYLGEPERLLDGRPTLREVPETFDQASLRHWPSVRAVLDQEPIAVMMPAFNASFGSSVERHPEWLVSTNVAVVQGPRPTALRSAPHPPGPLSTPRLVVLWAAVLAVLALAGSGWAVALSPGGWLERGGFAPAFGIGMLVLATVVAGRVGIVFGRGASLVVLSSVAVAGWALAVSARPPRLDRR